MAKINKKKFKEALKDSDGNITIIAQNLGVARNSVYNFIKKHKLEKELETEKQRTIERVKNRRVEFATEGMPTIPSTWNAMKSILTKSGDHIERQEIEHSGEVGGDNKLILEIIDAKDDSESSDEGSKKK